MSKPTIKDVTEFELKMHADHVLSETHSLIDSLCNYRDQLLASRYPICSVNSHTMAMHLQNHGKLRQLVETLEHIKSLDKP